MGVYTSWTMTRHGQGNRCFRGALRSTDSRAAIWECEHDHGSAFFPKVAALECADTEIAIRAGSVIPPQTTGRAGEDAAC